MRFVFRSLAILALAVAVIMAVLDVTRSVAMGSPVLTPLADSWSAAWPSALAWAQVKIAESLPGFVWDPFMLWVLTLPGFAVLAALSLLFYLVGRRWRRNDLFEIA